MKHEKLWECGNSGYKFPFPTPKEDPWTETLRPRQYKDAIRCRAWKEEVQVVLLFVRLFVLVYSMATKWLRTDPTEALLQHFLTQSGARNATEILEQVSISPDASVRINALWFLGLVFSLAAVLVGSVCLQWIREHEQQFSAADLEPQIAFSIGQMLTKSHDDWFVIHIFTILPLMLQTSLILFFLGLSDLLWSLSATIALPVTIAIGLTLLFLAGTTILPGLQALMLFLPWRFGSQMAHRNNYYENLTSMEGRGDWWEPMPRATRLLFRNKRGDYWLERDAAWLFQRDLDYMRLDTQYNGATQTFPQRPIPLYDAIQGILEGKNVAFSHAHFTPVDHCIASIVGANVMGETRPYARFLDRLSVAQPLSFGLPPEFKPSPEDHNVLQEDATLRLFSRGTSFDKIPPEAIGRCVEICVRLTAWMYGGKEVRRRQTTTRPDQGPLDRGLPIQLVTYALKQGLLDSEYTQQIRQQTRLIVLNYFEHTEPCDYPPNDHRKGPDTNECRFLSQAAKILASGDNFDICDEILERIHVRPRDDVYQAACAFCHAILLACGGGSVTSPPLQRFIKALYNYEISRNPPGSSTRAKGLRHLIFYPNQDWTNLIFRAQGLDSELDYADEMVGDDDRATLDDGVEQPAHTVVDILPPEPPA
ncbi:hypothetical protein H1R20_g626, partial [Candolleomyces eurysporus]